MSKSEKQINLVPYIVTFFSGAFIALLIFFVSLPISNLTIAKENDLILLDEDEFYVGEVFAKGKYNGQYEYLVKLYTTNDDIIIVISDDPYVPLHTEVIVYFNDGVIKMYEGDN